MNNSRTTHDNENRFRLLAENSSDVIYEVNSDLHFSYISPSGKELFGYSLHDFEGMDLYQVIDRAVHSEDITRVKEQILSRINGDRSQEIDDFRIYTSSGDIKWVSLRAKYLLDEEGSIERIVGNMRDITHRKLLERELFQDTAILDLLENHTKVAIIKINADFHTEYVSPSVRKLLGYSSDFFVNKSVLEVVHEDDKKELQDDISNTIKAKSKYFESEYRVLTKDGAARWVETNARLFYSGRGEFDGAIYIQSDITERKAKEHTIAKTLKEKDVLMRELNHRVKNNLAMVNSLISIKNSMTDDSIDLSDLMYQIDTIRLVHERLYKNNDIARVNISEYIEELLKNVFSSLTVMNIGTAIEVPNIMLKTKTVISLGLIINEIATNAVKYGFIPGSESMFSVSLLEKEEDNTYVLRISNTGNPFPEHITIDNPETFGLRLVSTLVEQLNGIIQLERKPLTTFTITFPIEK